MLRIYNITIYFVLLTIKIHALFNNKSKDWVRGRKNIYEKLKEQLINETKIAWFHCASLGEYEQAKELIYQHKINYVDHKILLTFFSSSGYKNFKSNKNIDYVFYLPIDTKKNAQKFIKIVDPKIAFFVKSEFWLNYLNELSIQKIPTFHISSVFRKHDFILKKSFSTDILKKSTYFFLQDLESEKTLKNKNILNCSVVGDTRFDAIHSNNELKISYVEIEKFCKQKSTIIFASVWPHDKHIFKDFIQKNSYFNYLVVPHEINYSKKIASQISGQLFSNFDKKSNNNVLIIDSIGMLKNLYKYCTIAYIGGGFGNGIHNILEASYHNIPVIFGPRHKKFNEAKILTKLNGAKSIKNYNSFCKSIDNIKNWYDPQANKKYFEQNFGASKKIISYLKTKKL